MYWNTIALSIIAALALPVVGLVTGRVVGDFFLEVFAPRSSRGDLTGAVGAAFGVLVYALALASSYSHLRHYYRGYEAQGVRASWALALAVEVATFYMSFAYLVIHSPWAFWGSLIGAFVVFWGNLSSMSEARLERVRAVTEADTRPAPVKSHRLPDSVGTHGAVFLSEEAVRTEISQVRQSVRAVKAGVVPLSEIPTGVEKRQEVDVDDPLPLSEGDKEVLRLAAEGPIGPSSVSRALGIAKSSAGDRLRRLERMELLVKQGSSYVVVAEGSTMRRARSI